MKCPKCGNELDKAAKFCPWCGLKVKTFCPKCNTELPEGVKFCPSCGSAVPEDVNGMGKDTAVPQPSNPFDNGMPRDGSGIKREAEPSENVGLGEKIKEFGQNLKEEVEKDDEETELTDDEYRNGLVKQAEILNVGYGICGLICIKSAWDYRELYGWKGGNSRIRR